MLGYGAQDGLDTLVHCSDTSTVTILASEPFTYAIFFVPVSL